MARTKGPTISSHKITPGNVKMELNRFLVSPHMCRGRGKVKLPSGSMTLTSHTRDEGWLEKVMDSDQDSGLPFADSLLFYVLIFPPPDN